MTRLQLTQTRRERLCIYLFIHGGQLTIGAMREGCLSGLALDIRAVVQLYIDEADS
ncbi:unnamed protein product [Hymenolepis diminuta]|uniref:Uncharacterized protein n=1 Tax=Hymenolepis diminuta TaxID=6216 RepID=A0A564ZBC4_HYMDI|nr:unnamed protein product [Hymenolepis diminuta]